jgi:hypothetical protein
MDIVRMLRRVAAQIGTEQQMAPSTWREDKELLYQAASEIERLRSRLDEREVPIEIARHKPHPRF